MGRDLRQPSDTGRRGFREPDEPTDERPLIVRAPFWSSESERLEYEYAVESNPRGRLEGYGSYIIRIAELVKGKLAAAAKPMPKVEQEEDWWQK